MTRASDARAADAGSGARRGYSTSTRSGGTRPPVARLMSALSRRSSHERGTISGIVSPFSHRTRSAYVTSATGTTSRNRSTAYMCTAPSHASLLIARRTRSYQSHASDSGRWARCFRIHPPTSAQRHPRGSAGGADPRDPSSTTRPEASSSSAASASATKRRYAIAPRPERAPARPRPRREWRRDDARGRGKRSAYKEADGCIVRAAAGGEVDESRTRRGGCRRCVTDESSRGESVFFQPKLVFSSLVRSLAMTRERTGSSDPGTPRSRKEVSSSPSLLGVHRLPPSPHGR